MAISGLERTYNNSTVIHEDLEDIISLISPTDTPLLATLNRQPVYNDVHYWVEDELRGMTSNLSQALTGSSGATKVYVQSGHGAARFPCSASKPILLRIGEEIMLGTSRTTDCITVTRDYATSGTAAAVSNAVVELIADLSYQGADARSALAQSRSKPFNYTQIFEATVQVSGTMDAVDTAGVASSESDYQEGNRLLELAIQLEKSIIHGARAVGAASTVQTMGGIRHYISTNKPNSSSVALTKANIEADARACFDAGGRPGLCLVNSFQSESITNLFESNARYDAPEEILGGMQIRRLRLPIAGMGELPVIVSPWMAQNELIILDVRKIALGVLRPFFETELGKTGDAKKTHIVGEYTFIMKNESAHSRRYGLTTS
jgi:hypothetical protein